MIFVYIITGIILFGLGIAYGWCKFREEFRDVEEITLPELRKKRVSGDTYMVSFGKDEHEDNAI